MNTPERANREGDQALPQPGRQDVFEDLIVHLRARQMIGIRRYGRSLQTFNGRDVGRDELEEFLDGWIYRWQARMERAELERENVGLRAALATAERLLEEKRGTSAAPLAEPEQSNAPPGVGDEDTRTSDIERKSDG